MFKGVTTFYGRPATAYMTSMSSGPVGNGMQSISGSGEYGSNDSQGAGSSKSLGFLKSLASDKKQTKDGQPPKRRGPKPDSKPALTRRQELNRQAQRTHRERKEQYIKALEQEVLRLKEIFTTTVRERDAVADENRRLKELLRQHGISYDLSSPDAKFQQENRPSHPASSYLGSSSASISGSYRSASHSTNFSPTTLPSQISPMPQQNSQQIQPSTGRHMAQLPNNRIDYDQVGIDFVLTLEQPCMDHMQYLLVRSHNPDEQPFHHPMEAPDDAEHEHMSGHVLMATAPPHSHILQTPEKKYPHKMPDVGMSDLRVLLQLSQRLPLDHEGEITPVMAWTVVYSDLRLGLLDRRDFEMLKADLGSKVRCYGFGAVLEEFAVRDALSSIFAGKENALGSIFAGKENAPALDCASEQQQVTAY